jgi:hypothetical protein
MRRIVCGLLVLVGCSSDTSDDVTGPFTGETRVFDVDKLTLPSTTALQNEFAGDLDGDGAIDNQLGLIVAALTQTNDTNKHVPDMIASGALLSYLELQADDLTADDSVGFAYFGRPSGYTIQGGGKLVAGAFASNRNATTKHPSSAEAALPVFADADPLMVPLIGVEVDLTPDGNGGFNGVIRGGIPIDAARPLAYKAVLQMMKTKPTAHLTFARMLDTNHDGQITEPELAASALLAGFIVDDVMIDGTPALSAAFGVHLCPHGQCNLGTPMNACTDRKRDGAETDIDCGGGTCPTCSADAACTAPADCESGACDGNRCRAPTCSDGFRDGYESDVDCGAACGKCATGKKCATSDDCASNSCNGSTGVCAP